MVQVRPNPFARWRYEATPTSEETPAAQQQVNPPALSSHPEVGMVERLSIAQGTTVEQGIGQPTSKPPAEAKPEQDRPIR